MPYDHNLIYVRDLSLDDNISRLAVADGELEKTRKVASQSVHDVRECAHRPEGDVGDGEGDGHHIHDDDDEIPDGKGGADGAGDLD